MKGDAIKNGHTLIIYILESSESPSVKKIRTYYIKLHGFIKKNRLTNTVCFMITVPYYFINRVYTVGTVFVKPAVDLYKV